jgi:ABC-type lipoprotein release transport system permease subunit
VWSVLRIGWRNIWRNRRRTIVNLSAIGLGLAMVIVYGGLMGGVLGEAKNQLDTSGLGHVELSQEGWRTHRAVKQVLPDPAGMRARLDLPPSAEVSSRIVVRALLSSSHGNEAVELHGVDFVDEAKVADYARTLRSGAVPAADDLKGLVVGEELAKKLGLSVGGKVRVMAQRADGELGADLFRVRGVFHAMTPALSRHRALIARAAASSLVGVTGAHQVVIQLDRAADADSVAARLRAVFGPQVAVETYTQLFPIYSLMEKLMDSAILVASIFVYLLVGLGILNTMLMSVLERTREFGVMQALGTRPSGVLTLVLAESFWVASLAVVLGLSLGLGLTWYGSHHVLLDYSQMMGEGMDLGGAVIKGALVTEFAPDQGLRAALAVYVMALFVGLVPAWRVSRMRPVDALHAR